MSFDSVKMEGIANVLEVHRAVVEQIPGIAFQFVCREEGQIRIHFLSPRFESVFAQTVDAVRSTPLRALALVAPRSRKKVSRTLSEAISGRSRIGFDVQVSTREGWRWYRIKASPQPTASGEMLYSGLAIDVTGEKSRLEALRKKTQQAGARAQVLECLSNLSGLMMSSGSNLGSVFRGAVTILRNGMRYPSTVVVKLSMGDRRFVSGTAEESHGSIQAPIQVEGRSVGSIEIAYRRQIRTQDEAFTREEQDLLTSAAVRIGRHVEQVRSRKALSGSESPYRAAFEIAPAPMWIEDLSQVKAALDRLARSGIGDLAAFIDRNPEFASDCRSKIRILEANTAAVKLLGAASRAEFIENPGKFLPQTSTEALKNELCAIAEGRRAFEIEKPGRTADGSDGRLIVRWAAVSGHEAAMDRMVVTVDAPEQKRIEGERAGSEKNYRTLVDHVGEAVVVTQEGKIRFANLAAEKLTGYSLRAMEGLPFDPVVHPEDREMVKDRHQRRTEGEVIPSRYRFRVVHQQGHTRWVEMNAGRISWNGRPAVLLVLMDVTERRQTEEALKQSEEHFRAVFDNAPLGISLADSAGRLLLVNAMTGRRMGYLPEALSGMHMDDLSHPEDRPTESELIADLVAGKRRAYSIQKRYRCRDGKTIWGNVTAVPIHDREGKVARVLGLIEDVTEKIERERQLRQAQKMEAIGTLAGGIAHDFNNILSAIIGYTDLSLLEAPQDTQLEDFLKEVQTAGIRGKDLVNQILTFARQADEKPKPIKVGIIAKEVLKFIRSSIPSSIEVRQRIESEALVLADPTQIHQVFMNLCTNAAHAMEKEGGVLEIAVSDVEVEQTIVKPHAKVSPGRYLRITVSDTGTGIPEEHLNYIFEPYFSTKRPGEGTGLGLAVVHGIVQNCGGQISVESQWGSGTVFTIYLPLTPKLVREEAEYAEVLPMGTERILFVDDELPITRMVTQMLERLGYQVATRTGSVEALELFKAKPDDFDLVITDMTMPNMSGEALARELLRRRPGLPVVLCTGYSNRMTEARAAELGISALVMKPITQKDLALIVRKVLDRPK
ncbi:MAG: PAS domain S-box protein [Desulfobacterales bacterium]